MQKTQVFIVRKCYLCVPASTNVNHVSQCSQDQKSEVILNLVANSTMPPRNSMRTKKWSFEQTTFLLKFGRNGRGAKGCS